MNNVRILKQQNRNVRGGNQKNQLNDSFKLDFDGILGSTMTMRIRADAFRALMPNWVWVMALEITRCKSGAARENPLELGAVHHV